MMDETNEERHEETAGPMARETGSRARVAPRPARLAALLSLATLLVAIPCAFARPAEPGSRGPSWYDRRYRARRQIVLPRGVEKGDPVLLRFSTAGRLKKEGRDIRVVVDHRVAWPYELLALGPGDEALVAFAAPPPEHALHVYIGSSVAPRPRSPRRLATGLMLEVHPLPEGDWDDEAAARRHLRAIEKRDPLGVLVPDQISLGLPPLGRTREWVVRCRGTLRVREEGEHRFETVSQGASFLWVDGRPVCSWPGFHSLSGRGDPSRRELHSGTVRLEAGLHSLEYVVASRSGGIFVLGWAEPGEDRTRPISARHYLPWKVARAGGLEPRDDDEPVVDFEWRQLSDTNDDAERHELAEVELRFLPARSGRRPVRIEWELGDGQRASGEEVRHVYLGHGVFEVTARITLPNGETAEESRQVAVRFESLRRGHLDGRLQAYYRATRGYDLDRLPEDHLRQLLWLRTMDEAWKDDVAKAVDAWFRRGLDAEDELASREGLRRAIDLARRGRETRRARTILEAIGRGGGGARAREARAWAAWLRGQEAKGPAVRRAAVSELEGLLSLGRTDDAARRAGILLARLHLASGEHDAAAELLDRLETGTGWKRLRGTRAIVGPAHEFSVLHRIRKKELEEAGEELERWEWELPSDRLRGSFSLVRARYLVASDRSAEALRELAILEAAPQAIGIRPRALLLAAEILAEDGRSGEARKRLERLLEEFPARPERADARRMLESL